MSLKSELHKVENTNPGLSVLGLDLKSILPMFSMNLLFCFGNDPIRIPSIHQSMSDNLGLPITIFLAEQDLFSLANSPLGTAIIVWRGWQLPMVFYTGK